MTNYKKTLKSGFTLIELLVVIAIIALLSAVVLASLNTARQKAKDAKVQVELNQIKTVLEAYYAKYGGYPNPVSETTPVTYCIGNTSCLIDGYEITDNINSHYSSTENIFSFKKISLSNLALLFPAYDASNAISENKGYLYVSPGCGEENCSINSQTTINGQTAEAKPILVYVKQNSVKEMSVGDYIESSSIDRSISGSRCTGTFGAPSSCYIMQGARSGSTCNSCSGQGTYAGCENSDYSTAEECMSNSTAYYNCTFSYSSCKQIADQGTCDAYHNDGAGCTWVP